MKNILKDVLFLIPIAAIFLIGIALHYLNKSEELEPSASSNTSAYKHPTFSANTASNSSDAVNYQNYAMTEPFAANVPFEFTPMAWMHMMNNMMNTMQMTQMMHQMMAMPTQMMMPMMGMNPHMSVPGMASNTTPNVMSPEQYEQWYNEQQKKLKQNQ